MPTASFIAKATADGHVLLFGSGSRDAEGQSLTFRWIIDGVSRHPNDCAPPSCDPCDTPICDFRLSPGTHQIRLEVVDPSDLVARTPVQDVYVW